MAAAPLIVWVKPGGKHLCRPDDPFHVPRFRTRNPAVSRLPGQLPGSFFLDGLQDPVVTVGLDRPFVQSLEEFLHEVRRNAKVNCFRLWGVRLRPGRFRLWCGGLWSRSGRLAWWSGRIRLCLLSDAVGCWKRGWSCISRVRFFRHA